MSEVYRFPFASLTNSGLEFELAVWEMKPDRPFWEPGMPNPIVPFPNQPTFVVEVQFYISTLSEHINDPESYLPGRVYGLYTRYRELILSRALAEAFEKNGITNFTRDFGSTETSRYEDGGQHVRCRRMPEIGSYDAEFQTPMHRSGVPGYNAAKEPWIPPWQIYPTRVSWRPMNPQRYDVFPMKVLSPVLPCTEESYQEVDRVAETIIEAFRVQKEFGPGIKVRCESRNNFRWPDTRHQLTTNLKQTLEARFSLIPQEDQEAKVAFAHQQFNDIVNKKQQEKN